MYFSSCLLLFFSKPLTEIEKQRDRQAEGGRKGDSEGGTAKQSKTQTQQSQERLTEFKCVMTFMSSPQM